MNRSKDPTPRQIEALRNMGLEPPPTKSLCSRLIGFIIKGNGTCGSDGPERISIAKVYYDKYVGKEFLVNEGGKTYQGKNALVLYLIARTLQESIGLVDTEGGEGVKYHPFRVRVRIGEQEIFLPISSLTQQA